MEFLLRHIYLLFLNHMYFQKQPTNCGGKRFFDNLVYRDCQFFSSCLPFKWFKGSKRFGITRTSSFQVIVRFFLYKNFNLAARPCLAFIFATGWTAIKCGLPFQLALVIELLFAIAWCPDPPDLAFVY
jgi:hypothetical protein